MSKPSYKWFKHVGLPGQFSTWFEHGTLNSLLPLAAVLVLKQYVEWSPERLLLTGALLANVQVLTMWAREESQVDGMDYQQLHARYEHATDEWISKYGDYRGDMVGPYTAWLAYWCAYLMVVIT